VVACGGGGGSENLLNIYINQGRENQEEKQRSSIEDRKLEDKCAKDKVNRRRRDLENDSCSFTQTQMLLTVTVQDQGWNRCQDFTSSSENCYRILKH